MGLQVKVYKPYIRNEAGEVVASVPFKLRFSKRRKDSIWPKDITWILWVGLVQVIHRRK